MPRVVFLFNQSNTFGLSQDAALIERALKEIDPTYECTKADPLQPPSNADIVFHLEIPHPVWLSWAPVQIWMVNPEWCSPNWLEYKDQFSQIWLKEKSRVAEFGDKAVHVPWAVQGPLKPVNKDALGLRQALWVLGASQNKHIAARALLPLWPSNFPLTVTTSLEEADLSGVVLPPSVTVKRGFLEAATLEELNRNSATHVAISAAEGYGFTAGQAEARSAALIVNTLPVYEEYYGGKSYAGFVNTPVSKTNDKHCGFVADFSAVTTEDLRAALQAIPSGEEEVQIAEDRLKQFVESVRYQIKRLARKLADKKRPQPMMPPTISPNDCPPISVLTLTYNRRNFIELAFLNMLVTDYPKAKIQWVIVDDSDDPLKSVSDKIKTFQEREPGFEITYVPMTKKRSIGYKRNRAVKAAKYDICLNMDDDDVYPETSFRRRVAWLLHDLSKKVVGCTMIAMYDLNLGISAVNTPPWALKQSQRVSEASFCFYKSFALDNPFPDCQQSEGESFVDRCSKNGNDSFLEIPPQQIVVALNHGTNTSGRVIAGRGQTGCFWGWDQRFIVWLHGLVGVQVEETTA
jgi:hypothetical protein